MSTDEGLRHEVAPDAEPPKPGGTVDEEPRFWHRAHPVFTPLSGFFTGVVTIIVVLAALGWVLEAVLDYDVSAHPWVLLVAVGVVFLVNLVLVALRRTRRFARYMLFGVLVTPAVIAGVAALSSWILIMNDG